MSALKVLDLAQQQGLLDEQAAAELRSQVAAAPRAISAQEIVQTLLGQGHLTQFQANRLLATAGEAPQQGEDLLAEAPAAAPAGSQDDDDDDDVVMLEAVEPETPPPPPAAQPQPPSKPAPAAKSSQQERPATKSPPSEKAPTPPSAKKANPPPPPAPKTPPPGVTAPMDLANPSTELQPINELQPIAPLRPIGGMKPLQPLEPIETLQPVDGPQPLTVLEPIGMLEPIGPAGGLTPLGGGDDLFADPLVGAAGLGAVDPLRGQPAGPPPPTAPARKKRNQWDSPLLLIGGGLLGVIGLAFGLLYLSLTRGSAAEMFAQADAEYNQGAYPSAIAAYDTFLKRYPDDPNASLARVRRGIAQIRSVSDGAKDPAAGLRRAQEVLPEIENEPRFNDARPELAQLLPQIADSFAEQAQQAQDSERRTQLVKSTEEAMELVTNPAYIPSSLRKDIEGRITAIVDKLTLARRSIDRDQELQTALAKMDAAADAGQVAKGYEIRKTLLRSFPKLSASASLNAATLALAERERELVEVTAPLTAAIVDDARPAGFHVVLADRTGDASEAAEGQRAFVLLEGAVYAIELRTGRIEWRRFVGLETTLEPVPLGTQADADVLAVDGRNHSLLRLSGPTGDLVWRQDVGEPFFRPAIAEQTVFTTTASGRLLTIDLQSGAIAKQAQLPQRSTVGPCVDSKRGRLYQLGEHSTLFVFDTKTLECQETHYLGHTPGAMLTAPVVALEHLLVPQSPSDDYSLVTVLRPSSKDGRLVEAVSPFRLKGRITAPLATSGRRAVAVTDLGQISVLEIDAGAEKQSVRELARVAATDSDRVSYSAIVEGSRLWIAGRRCSLYEIQGSVQQLSRVWSLHQDDAFSGPLQLSGTTLLHVRRRPGAAVRLVEACRAADGEMQWRTALGAPILAAAASEARAQVAAVTASGQVFEVDREALAAGVMDNPTSSPPAASGNWNLKDATPLGAGRWLFSNFARGSQALLYDISPAENRVQRLSVAAAGGKGAAPPALFHGGVLTPLKSGQVLLVAPETGREQTLPFQPTLEAGVLLPWTQAASLPPDGSAAAISDGLARLFRIVIQDQPEPHLAAAVEAPLAGPMERPLAATADALYGVTTSATGHTLTAYQLDDMKAGATWPLVGRCSLGPVAVGKHVFVADDESLYCVGEGQQLVWKSPLNGRRLAAPPLLAEGDLIAVHRDGAVTRLSLETGEELAGGDVGEPLGPASWIMGQRLLVGGADGVLHLVTLPRRP